MNVGPVSFQGSILLMIAIALGVVAAIITYINSRKLEGEVFEVPFVYLSLGILFVTFPLVVVALLQPFLTESLAATLHDVGFIVGLSLILTASLKITNFLLNMDRFTKKIK